MHAASIAVVCCASAALAQPFFTLSSDGRVHRFESVSNPGAGQQVALVSVSSPEGLAVAPDGRLYVMGWQNTSLRRVDPVTGQVTTLGPLSGSPPTGSFFKDLAWDHASGRLMALHFGTYGQDFNARNRLFTIDVDTLETTLVGIVEGDGPTTQFLSPLWGLAIDESGRRTVISDADGPLRVYDLGGAGGLTATRRPVSLGNSFGFHGLGAGGGSLIAAGGGGLWTVAADGAPTRILAGGDYRDVAVVVPSAATSAGLLLGAAVCGRRRRH